MKLLPCLSLNEALDLLKTALSASDAAGIAQNVAIVDVAGQLLAFARMDGANRMSADIAINKAMTAACAGVATERIAPRTLPGEPGYMIQNQSGGRFTTIGGGVPLKDGDAVVGGLGLSGGTVEQDITLAADIAARFEAGSA